MFYFIDTKNQSTVWFSKIKTIRHYLDDPKSKRHHFIVSSISNRKLVRYCNIENFLNHLNFFKWKMPNTIGTVTVKIKRLLIKWKIWNSQKSFLYISHYKSFNFLSKDNIFLYISQHKKSFSFSFKKELLWR